MIMILLNFTHPLTPSQLQGVESLFGEKREICPDIPIQFDLNRFFKTQIRTLTAHLPVTPRQWLMRIFLINLPSLASIAALLLADLQGWMGYFPAILHLRSAESPTPPRFEVAELIDWQSIRDSVREQCT
jgi:hypothetical protein